MLIPWQTFGVFIITMYRMLTDELLRFFCIYLFVCVGFTFALTGKKKKSARVFLAFLDLSVPECEY
jgi:hypothetical protein